MLQDFRWAWPGVEFEVLFLLLLLTLALLDPFFYFQLEANGLGELLHSGFLGQERPTLKDFVIEVSCFEFVPTQERWRQSPTHSKRHNAAARKGLLPAQRSSDLLQSTQATPSQRQLLRFWSGQTLRQTLRTVCLEIKNVVCRGDELFAGCTGLALITSCAQPTSALSGLSSTRIG